MPPELAVHLEEPGACDEAKSAADRLRAAAVREQEVGPLLEHIDAARRLLQQLSGFIASKALDVPIDIDQQVAAWLHADARQRKERQS